MISLNKNKIMKTKVTILGQEPIEGKKKIEFVEFICRSTGKIFDYIDDFRKPCNMDNIILLKKNYTNCGLDLMYAYEDHGNRCVAVLGPFNDGVV
mgnify:FL=1